MEGYEEKRSYQRYEHSGPMHLHRMDSQDQYYCAEMKDWCQGVVCPCRLMKNLLLIILSILSGFIKITKLPFVYIEIKIYQKRWLNLA